MMLPGKIDRDAIIKQQNQAARSYDRAAFLHHEIADRLLERLELMKIQPRVILDCGAKTGYTSRALVKRYPKASVIALDMASRLLTKVRKRWRVKKPTLICAESESLPFKNQSVDLIVSNLFLGETDLLASFNEFRRVLKPGGLALFSMLGVDTLKELRQSFAAVDDEPHAHEFVDMHDVGDLLLQSQLQDPVMDMQYLQLRYKNLESLFSEIKATGNQNKHHDRVKHLFGKNKWKEMLTHYASLRVEGKWPVTVEIIFGHAWALDKSLATTVDSKGEVVVPIDAIKVRKS